MMSMFGKLTAILMAMAASFALALACGADGGETDAAARSSVVSETAAVQPTAVASTGEIGFNLGDRIPEFEISLTSGEPLTSAQLRASERPAFLFFFSMT